MAKDARYVIRIDDTVTNEIVRTLRSEPHVIDTVTDKEYAMCISDGNITVFEQTSPTTKIPSNVGLSVKGMDIMKLTLMNL